MSNIKKSDMMSLFLGSSRSGTGSSSYSTGRYSSSSRVPDPEVASSRYSSSSRYLSVTSPTPGSSSRYSTVTSPGSSRRSYAPPSYSSRYIPSSVSSRWATQYSDSEEEDSRRPEERRRRRDRHDKACEDTEPESDRHRRGQPRGKQAQVTVLNEGAVIIKRQNQTQPDTSDEEEEEEETQQEIKEPEEPEPPPRDPLEVEEEALNEKLQTAGFFLSMPEEEQIKKRLLEIKHIRENPDWLNPENTKNFKYSKVSGETAKPSIAKEEEEKILLLRLSSRGITEVEQTDVQVRLQEIWRDRKEEVMVGIGRMEQHYEHILSECSTEISELEGSIGHKYAAIAKLQEEVLVLSMRKDRVSDDMEKVTNAHQEKMDVLKKEISDLDLRSSTYSVVRAKKVEESSLPESERSEMESELECPVCLEISRPPIYQCPEGHLVCSACKPLLKSCCICEAKFSDPPIRCRFAEKLAARYFKDEDEK